MDVELMDALCKPLEVGLVHGGWVGQNLRFYWGFSGFCRVLFFLWVFGGF